MKDTASWDRIGRVINTHSLDDKAWPVPWVERYSRNVIKSAALGTAILRALHRMHANSNVMAAYAINLIVTQRHATNIASVGAATWCAILTNVRRHVTSVDVKWNVLTMPSVASRNAIEDTAKCIVQQECDIASKLVNQGDARCFVKETSVCDHVRGAIVVTALSLKTQLLWLLYQLAIRALPIGRTFAISNAWMGTATSRVLRIIPCRVRPVMGATATWDALREQSVAKCALEGNVNWSHAHRTFAFKNVSLEDATWNATQGSAPRFAEEKIATWPVYLPAQNSVIRPASGEVVWHRARERTAALDALEDNASTRSIILLE